MYFFKFAELISDDEDDDNDNVWWIELKPLIFSKFLWNVFQKRISKRILERGRLGGRISEKNSCTQRTDRAIF